MAGGHGSSAILGVQLAQNILDKTHASFSELTTAFKSSDLLGELNEERLVVCHIARCHSVSRWSRKFNTLKDHTDVSNPKHHHYSVDFL